MQVSIGRIVHYVERTNEIRPMMVVTVLGDESEGDMISGVVFLDGNNDEVYRRHDTDTQCTKWVTKVKQDENEKAPGTWHWPKPFPTLAERDKETAD